MKKLMLIFLLAAWPLVGFALKVTSLYQVELAVISQTDDIKEQAMRDGFAQMLLKVSGDPTILNNPLVKVNLRRADYYVQDYSYSQPSTASSLYTIVINYSEPDVRRLLKKAGEQYWGDNRPLLLIWLTLTDKDNKTQIVDSESGNETFSKMSQFGKRIGLPLMFPLMDMSDMNQVSSDDVLNVTMSTLNIAAKRYAPDGLLIGNIKQVDNSYDAEWELIVGPKKWKWSMTDNTIDGLTDGIISDVSQTLAKYYIEKSNSQTISLKININKIYHGDDLKQLIQEIKQVTSVKAVDISQITGDQVMLSVATLGDADSFAQNLVLNQKLVFKSEDSAQNKLFYEWAH